MLRRASNTHEKRRTSMYDEIKSETEPEKVHFNISRLSNLAIALLEVITARAERNKDS